MEKVYCPFEGYEVVERLGTGSFGRVYKIRKRDEFGNEFYSAMKTISISEETVQPPHDIDPNDKKSISSYYREYAHDAGKEIKLMEQLSGNSNIVNYYDSTTIPRADGMGWDIYIRMECLTTIRDLGPAMFSEREVIRLGIDICKALEICGKHNLIHRDIKPANIFRSINGDYKLGDFGIAKMLDGSTMTTSTKAGAPLYMAPEVYNMQSYDARADLYSLGLVMYALMNCGRLPFEPITSEPLDSKAITRAATRRFCKEQMPAPLNGSDALKRIILQACQAEPKNRFAEATEMRRALETLLTGATVVPEKKKSKKTGMIALICGAAVLILGLIAALILLLIRNGSSKGDPSSDVIQMTETPSNAAENRPEELTPVPETTTPVPETTTPVPETITPIPETPTPSPTAIPETFVFGGEVFQTGETHIGTQENNGFKKVAGTAQEPKHISLEEVDALIALCPNLNVLILDYCYLDDYSRLAELKNLKQLCLMTCTDANGNHRLSDISWMAELTSLEHLNICHNAVSDIHALAGLTNLRYINLADNTELNDADLESLSGLYNLESLNLYTLPKITEISPLAALKNLQYLHLGHDRKVLSVEALVSLPKLSRLRLNDTGIHDLSYFSQFAALEMLDLSVSDRDEYEYYSLVYCPRLKNLVLTDVDESVTDMFESYGIKVYSKWKGDAWNLE